MSKRGRFEYVTTLSAKGQIVICKSLREKLGFQPKQKFKEYEKDGKIILEPIIPITELGGILKKLGKQRTKKELIKEIKSGWYKTEASP